MWKYNIRMTFQAKQPNVKSLEISSDSELSSDATISVAETTEDEGKKTIFGYT